MLNLCRENRGHIHSFESLKGENKTWIISWDGVLCCIFNTKGMGITIYFKKSVNVTQSLVEGNGVSTEIWRRAMFIYADMNYTQW
jgi:hypothetical protein